MPDGPIEELIRGLIPQVLQSLAGRSGDFGQCEDAVQEAALAAFRQWPEQGVPENPRTWLIAVADRRRIDLWRTESARRNRELVLAQEALVSPPVVPGVDDTLTLFMLCCHPCLTESSQVALTLRAVAGLSTTEIAGSLLVSESTVSQRILRAKRRIKEAGAEFSLPSPQDRDARLASVLRTLYLVFNEGHISASDRGSRVDLTVEAIRLARELRRVAPEEGEVQGLLALMLLTEARRPARFRPDGSLVPLADQDRSRWDAEAIQEGQAILEQTLTRHRIGAYQVQAAIAALHDQAASVEQTDWAQILQMYNLLRNLSPGPMVELNRAVALAMVHGPRAGLAHLDFLSADPVLGGHHRMAAVRAHLFSMLGEHESAREHYLRAAERTRNPLEAGYLRGQVAGPGRRPPDRVPVDDGGDGHGGGPAPAQ